MFSYTNLFVIKPNGTLDNAVTNPPSNSLWIGNISEDLTEEELLREFEKFGMIESIRLLHNCAFINYFSVEHASCALHFLQGKHIGQLNLRINFGKTRPVFDTSTTEEYDYTKQHSHSYEDPAFLQHLRYSPTEQSPMSSWSSPSPIATQERSTSQWGLPSRNNVQTQTNWSSPITIASVLSQRQP